MGKLPCQKLSKQPLVDEKTAVRVLVKQNSLPAA